MPQQKPLTRTEALDELRKHKISGKDVYLIDVIPLIEMMWADGLNQPPEWRLVLDFLKEHIDHLNELAGTMLLGYDEGLRFADRFAKERPEGDVLQVLTRFVAPVRLSNSSPKANTERKEMIAKWCLDIGAQCVAEYPHGNRERFDAAEKAAFMKILDALSPAK